MAGADHATVTRSCRGCWNWYLHCVRVTEILIRFQTTEADGHRFLYLDSSA